MFDQHQGQRNIQAAAQGKDTGGGSISADVPPQSTTCTRCAPAEQHPRVTPAAAVIEHHQSERATKTTSTSCIVWLLLPSSQSSQLRLPPASQASLSQPHGLTITQPADDRPHNRTCGRLVWLQPHPGPGCRRRCCVWAACCCTALALLVGVHNGRQQQTNRRATTATQLCSTHAPALPPMHLMPRSPHVFLPPCAGRTDPTATCWCCSGPR